MKSSIYSPFILNSKQETDEIWEISERKMRKKILLFTHLRCRQTKEFNFFSPFNKNVYRSKIYL